MIPKHTAYQIQKRLGTDAPGETLNGANRKQRRVMARLERQQNPNAIRGLSSHKVIA